MLPLTILILFSRSAWTSSLLLDSSPNFLWQTGLRTALNRTLLSPPADGCDTGTPFNCCWHTTASISAVSRVSQIDRNGDLAASGSETLEICWPHRLSLFTKLTGWRCLSVCHCRSASVTRLTVLIGRCLWAAHCLGRTQVGSFDTRGRSCELFWTILLTFNSLSLLCVRFGPMWGLWLTFVGWSKLHDFVWLRVIFYMNSFLHFSIRLLYELLVTKRT